MIEVPGLDMATAPGVEHNSKNAEKEHAQPLLEEDFDQVIAKAEAGSEGANDHQVVSFSRNRFFREKMIGILVVGGAALFLLGLISGLMIARYMGA